MLTESEVISRGIECFKEALVRYEEFVTTHRAMRLNIHEEWIPSYYKIEGVRFNVMTGMHLYDQCHYPGVIIEHPEKFDMANQSHLDALQIAQWLYVQMDTIGQQYMFCSGGTPDLCVLGDTSAHCRHFYDETAALRQLALYPHLPLEVTQTIESAIQNCQRIYEERLKAEAEAALLAMRASKRYGYIYLIQSPTGSYKIGRTRNPEDRMKTFNVKLPFEVDYVHLIETSDMYGLERAFHKKYAPKRVNGEWFMLDAEDVQYICQFKQVHP